MNEVHKMKNIVFFVSNLDSGGLENYLLRFLQEKSAEFQDVYVFCKSGQGGQLEKDYLKLSNVEIVKREMGYLKLKAYKDLKSFLINKEITAICDFTGNFAGILLKVAKSVGVKKRITFYRGSSDHFKKDVFRNIYNKLMNTLVFRNATDILSNSKAALNYFYPIVWKKDVRFKVIYNGINALQFANEKGDLRKEFNIPEDAFVVGHTGRYNEAKNHSTIIAVAEKLVKSHCDIYFIMCGNGVKDNLQSVLKERGIDESRVLLFENRRDIPKFLNSMDCYYFPSITEGQPNALIEAMIMGLPFVASNIEPIKETVSKQYYKQLVDPFDIGAAKDKIIEIKEKKRGIDAELSNMSKIKYDANFQFGEFLDCIYFER